MAQVLNLTYCAIYCTVKLGIKLLAKHRTARALTDLTGKCPFEDFLRSLKDVVGKAKILARVERAELGNFGDYKHLENGLFEMRENFGPGYRIYFAIEGDEIIVLLLAGTKRGQSRDVEVAKKYLLVFRKGRE